MTERRPDFDDSENNQRSRSEIDVYDKALRSPGADDFLESENLGLGYYENAERWQQIESYRHGLFGNRVFAEPLIDRAIDETKRQLAVQGQNFYDRAEQAPKTLVGWDELSDAEQRHLKREKYIDKKRWIDQQGEKIWKVLSDRQRKEAVAIATGLEEKWTPPHWRMLMARHETSRSRDARLLDNVFGREQVQKVFNHTSNGDSGGLLNRGGGNNNR